MILRWFFSKTVRHASAMGRHVRRLLAAQQDPEKYRNLIVRIAGYSAYFVDLSPALQAEILARTEQQI